MTTRVRNYDRDVQNIGRRVAIFSVKENDRDTEDDGDDDNDNANEGEIRALGTQTFSTRAAIIVQALDRVGK